VWSQKQIKIVNGTPIDAKHTHGRILKILIEEPKEAVSEFVSIDTVKSHTTYNGINNRNKQNVCGPFSPIFSGDYPKWEESRLR
jgi:hypothetical protein